MIGHRGFTPVDDRQRRSWIDAPLEEGTNVVAEGRDGPVDHAVYTPRGAGKLELAVFVHPKHQGRGIGTELRKRVITDAVEADREAPVLHGKPDNRTSRSVYRRIGFESVERDHERRMRPPLDAPFETTDRESAATARRKIRPSARSGTIRAADRIGRDTVRIGSKVGTTYSGDGRNV